MRLVMLEGTQIYVGGTAILASRKGPNRALGRGRHTVMIGAGIECPIPKDATRDQVGTGMANAGYLETLKQGVEDWNKWREEPSHDRSAQRQL